MVKCQDYDLEEESKFFIGKLRELGFRITEQRKHLVQAIIKFNGPFSADDLFEKQKKNGIDLATIYRSLTTFIEHGLLIPIDFSDGVQKYEYLSHNGQHHHHHVICTGCKKIEPIKFCAIFDQEKLIEKMGYTSISHRLEFFGLCSKCS